MKKLLLIVLLALFVLCISCFSKTETISKGILRTQSAWAQVYTVDPDYPEPTQTDIDLMQQ